MKTPEQPAARTININDYPEIQPKSKIFKKAYIFTMLLVVGRGIEATAQVDESVKKIFEKLPDGFTFCLGIAPSGPYMVARKNKKGKVEYLGWKRYGKKIDLALTIKNIESAFKVFTFQESTALAYNYDRFMVEGYLPHSLDIVRVLDIVEIYLLPAMIARLAVKRYPDQSELPPWKKHLNRIRIYLKSFSPGLLRVIYRNM